MMRRQSSQIIGKRIDMNDVPDTELFSAYLDGELTADEQVRVEQILAASPEARLLLEELRALDSTLQGLPQEKLDEDLTARVLEVAERRMLLPDRPFDTGEPGKGEPGKGGDNKPSAGRAAETLKGSETGATGWLGIPWGEISLRGMLSKRALIWSGVVVATAIIIYFTSPPPKPNQEFARLDKAPVTNAPTVAGEEGSWRSKSEGNLVGPAASLESRIGDRPAKDERRTATEVGDRLAKAEADGVRDNGKDRKAEDLVRVRQPADHDALSSKEAESLAEPGSTAEREKVAKDSAEKAGADKADQGSPRGAEKPAAAVKFAGGGSPASGATAEKLAKRDGTGFQERSGGDEPADARLLREADKGVRSNAGSGPTGVVGGEKKKDSPPIESFAENRPAPAAAPMPAAPAVATPSQPDRSKAGKLADKPPLSGVATTEAPAPAISLGAVAPPKSKGGPGKAGADDVALSTDQVQVAKGGNPNQPMKGIAALAATGNSASTGIRAARVIRLNVSAMAMQNGVFEKLLADNGLGSEQDLKYAARKAPADNYLNGRSVQPGQGVGGLAGGGGYGLGGGYGGGGPNAQQNVVANNSSLRGGMPPSGPAGSASAGTSNLQPPLAPQSAPALAQKAPPATQNKDASGANQTQANSQPPAAAGNLQGEMASQPQFKQRDERSDVAKGEQQQWFKPLICYDCEVTPQQLADIMKKLSDKPDAFSVAETVPADSASQGASSLADNFNYGAIDYRGGTAAKHGGQQTQARPDAGGARGAPAETAQPQAAPAPVPMVVQQAASPAAGVAKQRVIFELNVVDHVVPAASAAPQLPAATAPPAK
jgi:hypothetical protein